MTEIPRTSSSRIKVLPPSIVGHYLKPEELDLNNRPLILGDVGPNFYAAASLYPTTPEIGKSTNIMVWPKEKSPEQKVVHLKDIKASDLWHLSQYALGILDQYPDSAVTYGISEDPRGITGTTRKALGTSIETFHLHNYVNISSDLIPSPEKRIFHSLREPFPEYLAILFRDFIKARIQHTEIFKLSDQALINDILDPYINIGGIVLADEGSDKDYKKVAELADLMRDIDVLYDAFHHQIMDIFFKNYQEVKESKWQERYEARDIDDIQKRLMSNSITDNSTVLRFLQRATPRIIKSDDDSLPPELKIFRSPTYSVGIVKNRHGQMCVAVNPHFYAQRAGGLQTLGIEVQERIRVNEKSPYDMISDRTARAKEADKKIRIQITDREYTVDKSHEIIPLEDAESVSVLNNRPPTFDPESEYIINKATIQEISNKLRTLPSGAAFYNGPAFFPHRIRLDKNNFYIEGANWPKDGYFRHVTIRGSRQLQEALRVKGLDIQAGLAVSILVEVETDDGMKKVLLTQSQPTEYAPNGIFQMPGGSYQYETTNLKMPEPIETAQLELAEELGVVVSPTKLKPLLYLSPPTAQNPTLVYRLSVSQAEYNNLFKYEITSLDKTHIYRDNDRVMNLRLVDPNSLDVECTPGASAVLNAYHQLTQSK